MGIILLFLLLCNFDYGVPAATGDKNNELKIPGTYMILAYFNVHNKSSNGCGEIQEIAGLQRVEVALQAIDEIRSHCKIGILIKDTCDKNDVSASTDEDESRVIGIVGPATSEQTSSYFSYRCPSEWSPKYKYALHTLFATTSTKVNSRCDSSRLVPTDTHQVHAILSLIRKIGFANRTQVGVNFIATKGEYGEGGMKEFLEETSKLNKKNNETICANVTMVMKNEQDKEFEQILNKTLDITQIIVCFCDGDTLRKLLLASKRMNAAKKFIFIASDRWIEKDDVLQDVENEAEGNFVIHIKNLDKNFKFNNEYPQLNKTNHTWWQESRDKIQNKFTDPKLPFIKQSIESIVSVMQQRSYDRDDCNPTKIDEMKCSQQRHDGIPYMPIFPGRSDCSRGPYSFGNQRYPIDKGSVYNQYEIIQFQKNNISGQIELKTVGEWNEDVPRDKLTWYGGLVNTRKIQINTKCMINCSAGDFVNIHSCCWTCEKCQRNNYTSLGSETKCDECDRFERAFENKTDCEPKYEVLIYWNEWDAIMVISVSVIGIFITLVSAIIYYKHIEVPIVAHSCPQLSLIMFNGMILTYLCTFLLIARPNNLNCGIVKFLTSISLTLIYAPLLAKTNRISRALTVTKLREPQLDVKYFSISFLMKVTVIMIAVEMGMASLVEFRVYDAYKKDLYTSETEHEKEVIYYCNKDEGNRLVSRELTNLFLLFYCCLYGYKTIKLPDNFHETKFIVSTCATTIAVLVTYFSIYTSVFGDRSAAISLCLLFSTCASISLVGLFFPKLYIVLWRPKNYEECFTPKLVQPPPPNPESPNEIDMSVWESLGVASKMNSDFNEIPMQEKPES